MFLLFAFFLTNSCQKEEIGGCTWPDDPNYNADATFNDGSCAGDTIPYVPYTSPPDNFFGSMMTSYSENWDDWDFNFNGLSGYVTTSYAENWDDWDFSIGGVTGSLTTSYAENWDDWDLTTSGFSISMKTSYADNWDDWDVDGNSSSWHVDVATSYAENWDDWDAFGDSCDLDLYTSYSENWDDWDVSGFFGSTYPIECKIAVLFVPVIVTVLRQQGIIP